ncbi:hypothetical protein CDL12_16311 [Handroanthus impetiginosus]|uniref:Uncharacterized protein n=1 Tax=Handroanthus impetiginosus TaxID=429701 RepID=A0A2G9H0P5_9LAMI|nr:hypothetical protein CDL12_16311 [Handroanthus impetiginosus]
MTFRQGVSKIVYEAWSRFRKMLRNCPNHDIPRHIQVHTFYHGLTDGGKDKLDHLNGDSFLSGTTAECHNLLNNLKLHINIPFAETLEQMPSYVKFMKDILSKKRRLGDYETVALTQECIAIIQNKLPPKLKDPGSFTIPCTIGTHFSGRALCDLGASINLMPYSIYRTLGLGEAKPTSITLQLADRSLTYPKGVIEDILVKVDKFIFPADFIVLDMEMDSEIPIILGRPFLATGKTLIDVQKGELTMRVQDQQITFNVFKAMKFPNESDECFFVSLFDNLAGNKSIAEQPLYPLERALLDLLDEENEEDREVVKTFDASKYFKSRGVESLERTAPSKVLKPSIEEPPTLELKCNAPCHDGIPPRDPRCYS